MHWVIASRAARMLADTPGEITARECRAEYLLGAVSPDTLYYSGSHMPEVQSAADRAHGSNGENTYDFLHAAMDYLVPFGTANYPLYAFLSGILAHIAADSIFHPLVYYYCGVQDATERHWMFETRMDLAIQEETEVRTYRELLRKLKLPHSQLVELLRSCFPDVSVHDGTLDRLPARVFRRAIRRHALIQGLFSSSIAEPIVAAMSELFPRVGRVRALSYAAQRGCRLDAFTVPISFSHPVTGEEETVLLSELVDCAAGVAADSARTLWRIAGMPDAAGRRAAIDALRGPSLETGLVDRPGDFRSLMTVIRPDLFPSMCPTIG